jgi:hypothetical protein
MSYASSYFDPPLLVDTFVMDHESNLSIHDINDSDLGDKNSRARSFNKKTDVNRSTNTRETAKTTAKDDSSSVA